ncbi:LAFE_0H00320g1_1 [Lachancea fermentati]|uniref:LAFE_0H00320g1_1 n=1 Tax=Lachancea fermentati TaxID=4955 RepID=A0A1G4MIX2_LACFM|nr:LAFE_0H00320g1_1 [Lachancea fermentati]
MTGNNGFYNPLDQSQIAFIPTDLESINENDSLNGSEDSVEKAVFGHYSNRASIAMSDISHGMMESSNSLLHDAYPNSLSSREDEMEKLSSISSGSTCGTNMSHGVRYKIVLKLSSREIKLIRGSWSMMLNDDISGNKISSSFRKLINDLGLIPTTNKNRKTSTGSVRGVVSNLGIKMRSGGSSPAPAPINTSTIASSLFCAQFYANLLAMDSDLERMFPSIKHQAIAFAGVLTMAINNLENLSALESYLSDLGKRHSRILGIHTMHFELMGMAFLKTIQDRFGIHSSIELEETWSRLYSYLANSILQFGIDPILKIDYNQNVLVFPVPDLVKKTPTTTTPLISPFNSNSTHKNVNSTQMIGTNYHKNSSIASSIASNSAPKVETPSQQLPGELPASHSREPYMFSVRRGAPSKPPKKEPKSSFNGLTKRVSISRGEANDKDCILM